MYERVAEGRALRMGIVGAGTWGENHARIYAAHPRCQVVAVADEDGDKASGLAERLGLTAAYDNPNQMFQDERLDAVAIVTPDFAHADLAVAAAGAGLHLLIEKPLATSREDVRRIVDAVSWSGVRAMVDLHNRFSPPFNVAHQQVRAGKLGALKHAYMRLNDAKWVATDMLPWAAQSSILWFLGSHSIDTLRWILADEVVRVFAVSTSGVLAGLGVDTVDCYLTTLEFAGGAIAHMENGWINPNRMPCVNDIKFTAVGDKGMVSIDASSHNLIQTFTDDSVEVPDILVKHSVFDEPSGFAFQSLRTFVDCLAEGREFPVTLVDAARVSLVVLAVMESAETRQPVEVMYN